MSRMKSIFAVLVLTAIVGVVPQAYAAPTITLKVVAAGSSAMWQTMALGAFNNQVSIVSGGGITCHWTSGSNKVNLSDTRPAAGTNNDPGTLWVVWDNNTTGTCDGAGANVTTNVWAYLKVDSVVGVRCYFAQPHCNINGANADLTTTGSNQISATLFGSSSFTDSAMPLAIETIVQNGTLITAAATDIRPEDAAFAACRVNSALGASVAGGGSSDGVDGLGYNSNNPAGQCPVFISGGNQNRLVGNPILSGEGSSTAQANVLAFNITGHDPFNNTVIPAFSTYAVGAAPIVFVVSRNGGQLATLKNASEIELQQVFSGTNCDASAFSGLGAGAIAIHLREALSGTMNATEATVFRRPTVYPGAVLGLSQELNVGTNNPLKANAGTCLAGAGARYRSIGTGEEIGKSSSPTGVYGSVANYGHDGIGYTFFSYGNVGSLANSANYGYLTLNGIDPIFQTYGSTLDAGQPTTAGTIPGAANLPATCAGGAGAFPCNEALIWKNGFSFPNLRNGTYRSWSLLRLVSTGTNGANASALASASNKYVVSTVPDYVPALTVPNQGGTLDLGLKLLRSHYQQKDGNGVLLGAGPVANSPEKGGDMGGYIIPTVIGVTTYKQTRLIQNATADNSNLGPIARP